MLEQEQHPVLEGDETARKPPVALISESIGEVCKVTFNTVLPLAVGLADSTQPARLAVHALVPQRLEPDVAVVAAIALELPRYAGVVHVQIARHVCKCPPFHDVVLYGHTSLT